MNGCMQVQSINPAHVELDECMRPSFPLTYSLHAHTHTHAAAKQLLTFLRLKQPGPLFRTAVLVTQAAFFNVFFFAYLINPRICHRLVGYIEEEAVKTVSGWSKEGSVYGDGMG